MMKTDKRDALSLANTLYTQLALGAQAADKMQLVRHALPPTKAAAQLRGLVQHRYELSQESTQRRNKLTAICDEIFPEFTRIFRDPNRESALAIREHFPTPQAIAMTSLAELRALYIMAPQIIREILGVGGQVLAGCDHWVPVALAHYEQARQTMEQLFFTA